MLCMLLGLWLCAPARGEADACGAEEGSRSHRHTSALWGQRASVPHLSLLLLSDLRHASVGQPPPEAAGLGSVDAHIRLSPADSEEGRRAETIQDHHLRVKMKVRRLRKVELLACGHAANKRQSRNSNPGPPGTRVPALRQTLGAELSAWAPSAGEHASACAHTSPSATTRHTSSRPRVSVGVVFLPIHCHRARETRSNTFTEGNPRPPSPLLAVHV